MFPTRLRMAGRVLFVAGLAATGAGVWARQEAGLRDGPVPPSRPSERVVAGPGTVARVNGVPITRDELIERCLERHGAKELEALIRTEVVRGAAERGGIRVTDDEVLAEATRSASRLGLSVEEWARTLAEKRGISKDQYLRDVIYPGLVLKKLGGSGPDEGFKDLMSKAEIVVTFGQPAGRGDAAAPDDAGPRHRAAVTCFNNPKDESGTLCSSNCYQEDGTLFKTGKMTCGFKGSVSEVEWKFVGRERGKDRYRFTRRFPVEVPGTTTSQKEVEFAGERIVIFEDETQRIVMDRPRK